MFDTIIAFLMIGGFFAAIIYTFIVVSNSIGSNDNTDEMKNAITNVAVSNSVMTALLALISTAYITRNPQHTRIYFIILLHAALLISIISVSITALQKLDTASTSR